MDDFSKGSNPKRKCHKLWKKSIRGVGGQSQNQNSLHFKCRLLWLEGGGSEFFTFFPISIILQLFCNITFIRNVYISNFSQFWSRGAGEVNYTKSKRTAVFFVRLSLTLWKRQFSLFFCCLYGEPTMLLLMVEEWVLDTKCKALIRSRKGERKN